MARNITSSTRMMGQTASLNEFIVESMMAEETEEEEEVVDDIVAYNILFEQRENNNNETTTSIFQLPFARIGRLLDNRSDEESEEGDGLDNYHQRSFLDNLADILSDYTQDIETTTTPSIQHILANLNKNVLISTDPDVDEECIICQDTFGTTLEIFDLPCHHKFHGACISRWLNIKTSCPVCRQPAYGKEEEDEEEEEEEDDTTSSSRPPHHLLVPLEDIIDRAQAVDSDTWIPAIAPPYQEWRSTARVEETNNTGERISSSALPTRPFVSSYEEWASMEEVD
ncbi:hypothetical protein INT47_002654 [Mucor saturninus]|uniref:RING-type domain-containing protein n=1 Tax=Mucor saturninus TaxID=64648 RepID=A0A8H7R6Z8_9FUNG|nr:hypothetical protein INT47_002654 [Mucor saturninus]